VIQPDGNAASYAYDLLDDQISAKFPNNSGGQGRQFIYSTLGRLITACNPESVPDGTGAATTAVNCQATTLPSTGVDQYSYDNNGNPMSHTDSRGATTTFGTYGGMNRPTSKSYSDGTPTVQCKYDQNVKGTLTSVTSVVPSGNNSTAYTYDYFGRVTGTTQTTAGQAYPPLAYGYSLTDQLTSMTYPSGRVVTYSLDSADRINGITGLLGSTPSTYASGITYTAHGGLSSLALGNGVTETHSWNDRLQQVGISVGPASSPGSIVALNFYPCDQGAISCGTNNGNIWRKKIGIGGATQADQEYRYDSLNRVTVAAEKGLPGHEQRMVPSIQLRHVG